jgi:hypothetical protein
MTTELDIRIAEIRERMAELREQGENADMEEWTELEVELEHLVDQKIVVQQLKG